MPGCTRPLLAVGLVLAVVGGTTGAAHADEDIGHRTVFSFTDPAITESSGLVARGAVIYTVNDSGDGPQIYAVNRRTGDTVRTTTYTSDVVSDVEALAPGLAGDVWVGDTGDNNADRPTVAIYRVPATEGRLSESDEATRFDLVYPETPHDAETLLVHPRTGRLYVVSKTILGGTVYQAPASLDSDEVNRLSAFAQVPGLVTDGSFFPDGEHVLLRTYGSASIYTFPGFRPVGTVTLPRQEQGEGIAVSATGQIYVSTEGLFSEVDQVFLPQPAVSAQAPSAASTPQSEDPASVPASNDVGAGLGSGAWIALVAGLLAFGGWLFFTASRRRSPHRR